jgi:uncharacterized cupin superfamily protein
MPTSRKPAVHLRAAEIAERRRAFTQRLNPGSRFEGTPLARLAGFARTGVALVRLAPGQESFAYHAHLREEEWLYVVSGRGLAEVDGRPLEVGPGDFLGFPAPSVAHILRNSFGEELVYLTGGERLGGDGLDDPRLGKRYLLLPEGDRTAFHELGPAEFPFGPAEGSG